MSVFLSRNNTEPYQIIDTIDYPIVEYFNYVTDNIDMINEIEGDFYLIVEDENLQNVEIEVSIVYEFGVDLKISKTDLLGNPIEYKQKISLGNIDATGTVQKFLIKYKWLIVNNIYFVKIGEKSALINVTAEV